MVIMRLSPFQEDKAWMTQLLSVACLSLAAKMEETYVPPSLDLQVRDSRVQCGCIYRTFRWSAPRSFRVTSI